MPDTSKMTPEVYKAFVDAQATGRTPEQTLDAAELRELIKIRERRTFKDMSDKFWDDRIDENGKERLAQKKPSFHSPEELTKAIIDKFEEEMWTPPKNQGESMSEPMRVGPWKCGECGHEYGEHASDCPTRKRCRACGKILCDDNLADGCACNGPRGCNHGLVPERTCTCKICDPAQTGSVRPTVQTEQSSQEQFKPGQTVYSTAGGRPFTVIAQDGGDVWGRWATNTGESRKDTIPAHWLTATDPNKPAEPEPQKCPFCGKESQVCSNEISERHRVSCRAIDCNLVGPFKPTRLEAIQAWNSIRVVSLSNPLPTRVEWVPKLPDDPLTEEWLRKVGLFEGIRRPLNETVAIRPRNGGWGLHFWEINAGPAFWLYVNDLLTIGHARQLCRLLGVPLKE